MGSFNEKALLRRIRNGEKAAFSEIFKAYYTDLVIFAFSFVKDKETAEEIAQDVFVKLWDTRASLDIRTSIKSFLIKSIQNKCIDWIRHQKIKNKYMENQLKYQSSLENETENHVLYSELAKMIEKTVEDMPETIQSVYRQNRFEGNTYQEIADKMGLSVRTVEVRISKALVILREKLHEYL